MNAMQLNIKSITQLQRATFLTDFGLEGDKNAGHWHRQLRIWVEEKTQTEEILQTGENLQLGENPKSEAQVPAEQGTNLVLTFSKRQSDMAASLQPGCRLCGASVVFELTQVQRQEGGLLCSGVVLRGGDCSVGEQLLVIDEQGCMDRLVICGSGHVALALISLAKTIGFHVTVVEDRASFLEQAKQRGADLCIESSFAQGLSQVEGSPNTYFVIMTREHTFDLTCLELILSKTRAYVGMMGSRGRVEKVRNFCRERGVDEKVLAALHAPIGLSIGAGTPEEIAVSVAAELIQVRAQLRTQQKMEPGFDRRLIEPIEAGGVLCTILKKQGSAPRDQGTRMVVLADGQVGTIGGGLLEARVTGIARQMLAEKKRAVTRVTVDMNGNDDKESLEAGAMFCGGRVEVCLEKYC